MELADIIVWSVLGVIGAGVLVGAVALVVARMRSGSDRLVLPEEFEARHAAERQRQTEGFGVTNAFDNNR